MLYWECSHGCKIMLEFDRFGRLSGKHRCPGAKDEQQAHARKRRKPFDYDNDFDLPSISKTYLEKQFMESYQCPACGLLFSDEAHFRQHLKQKREQDDEHHALYHGKVTIEKEDTSFNPPRGKARKQGMPEHDSNRGQGGKTVQSTKSKKSPAPEIVSPVNTTGDGFNNFGRVRFKGKDGKATRVHSHQDWYEAWKEAAGVKDREDGDDPPPP